MTRGRFRKPGKPWTVAGWLRHWVDEIAKPSVRESTYSGYEEIEPYEVEDVHRLLAEALEAPTWI
ncbi:hypothetical protein [Streptomyces sp. 184]|uniref:hypothetical protein n=1 Tax=Streptomyces sp. 184 TaxID=1827526 RepID=UPI0038926F90